MAASPQSACLDESTIQALISGGLEAETLRHAEAHLADCRVCRELLASVARPAQAFEVSRALLDLPQPGHVLAEKYRLGRVLGRGGMGTVFAARHMELGHVVAIKVLHLDTEDAVPRFLREAETCARLGSEQIPRVFDLGRLPAGAPYIVMEYLIGEDLARVVQRGPLAESQALEYLRQACQALAPAHAAGIIHRDLKPANLFVSQRNDGSQQIKVLDFGISKLLSSHTMGVTQGLTSTGTVLGSPLYMSPEQMRASREVDSRSDIWSLGVILYELLTGRRPFEAPTLGALGMAIATETPAPPSMLVAAVHASVDAVVMRCLEKLPARRFSSIEAFSAALHDCVANPLATPPRSTSSARIRTALPVTAAALADLTLSGESAFDMGGEAREMTVFFSDIRGFTAMSETRSAQEIVAMLNDYFEQMVEIIVRYEGTVDKFVGDEIMALFGATVGNPDDAYRAVKVAWEQQRVLAEWNDARSAKGEAPIHIGVGISSGKVVAGYLGSSSARGYSVIGEVVNIASRLCGVAKSGDIILGKKTCDLVKEYFDVRELSPIEVRGKAQPVQLYKVLAERAARQT